MNVIVDELLFRIMFSGLWMLFLANLIWVNRSAAWISGRRTSPHANRLRIAAIAFACIYLGGSLLYSLFTSSVVFLLIPLPDWLRLVMVCVAAAALLQLMWALRELGRNWAPSLSGVRKDTILVTTGPYGVVRHPIYLGAFIFLAALAIEASNWVIVIPTLVLLVLLYAQLDDEEVLLIDRFGEEYRRYMKRTPRFIPRLTRKIP